MKTDVLLTCLRASYAAASCLGLVPGCVLFADQIQTFPTLLSMRLDLLVRNCDRALLYLGGHGASCVWRLVEFWSLVEREVAECEIVLDLWPCQRWLMIIDAADPPFAGLIKNERVLEIERRCSGTRLRDNTNGAQVRRLYGDGSLRRIDCRCRR